MKTDESSCLVDENRTHSAEWAAALAFNPGLNGARICPYPLIISERNGGYSLIRNANCTVK
jgi:hypothetical protein